MYFLKKEKSQSFFDFFYFYGYNWDREFYILCYYHGRS